MAMLPPTTEILMAQVVVEPEQVDPSFCKRKMVLLARIS